MGYRAQRAADESGLVLILTSRPRITERPRFCLFAFTVTAVRAAVAALLRKGGDPGGGTEELWPVHVPALVVLSPCDPCFHDFSPVRHSTAVTPWEHYKLQCNREDITTVLVSTESVSYAKHIKIFNSTRLNQLGPEPKQLIIRRDQHFTLQLNMRRTHILRLETTGMQTSVIHVVSLRHL